MTKHKTARTKKHNRRKYRARNHTNRHGNYGYGNHQIHKFCESVSLSLSTVSSTADTSGCLLASFLDFSNNAINASGLFNIGTGGTAYSGLGNGFQDGGDGYIAYPFSMAFSLDTITNMPYLASCFDKARIKKIKIRFIPCNNVSSSQNECVPSLQIYNDYDDQQIPPNTFYVEQREDTKEVQLMKPFDWLVYPKFCTTTSAGAYTIPTNGLWMTNSPSEFQALWYGVKGCLRNVPCNNDPTHPWVMRVQIRYYFECKDFL